MRGVHAMRAIDTLALTHTHTTQAILVQRYTELGVRVRRRSPPLMSSSGPLRSRRRVRVRGVRS